jgi:hypothetical protein
MTSRCTPTSRGRWPQKRTPQVRAREHELAIDAGHQYHSFSTLTIAHRARSDMAKQGFSPRTTLISSASASRRLLRRDMPAAGFYVGHYSPLYLVYLNSTLVPPAPAPTHRPSSLILVQEENTRRSWPTLLQIDLRMQHCRCT